MIDVHSFIEMCISYIFSVFNQNHETNLIEITNTPKKTIFIRNEIKDVIVSQLHDVLFDVFSEDEIFRIEDLVLTNKISILKEIAPEEIDINLKLIEKEKFNEIIELFNKWQYLTILSEKKQKIKEILKDINKLNEDLTFKILVYCIIQSDIQQLFSKCQFIDEFFKFNELEEIYNAIDYIQDLDYFIRNSKNEVISRKIVIKNFKKSLQPFLNYTKELRSLKDILILIGKSIMNELPLKETIYDQIFNKILISLDISIEKNPLDNILNIEMKTRYPPDFYLQISSIIEIELSKRKKKTFKNFNGKKIEDVISFSNHKELDKISNPQMRSSFHIQPKAIKKLHAMTTLPSNSPIEISDFSLGKLKRMNSIQNVKTISIFEDPIRKDLFCEWTKGKELYPFVEYYEKFQEYAIEKSFSEKTIIKPQQFYQNFFSKGKKRSIDILIMPEEKYNENVPKFIEEGYEIVIFRNL